MRKILIALSIGLCGVITSCDWFGSGGGDPEIIIPPEFVQAGALPASVEYNGSTTFLWEIKYAKSVTIDGITVDPKGSMELKNLVSNKTIQIVAYGEGSLSSSRTVAIPVSPAPIILNAGDTLSGSWIRTIVYLTIDNGVHWYEEKSEEKYVNEKYIFSTSSINSNEGNLLCYLYPYSVNDKLGGNEPWKISGRNLTLSDQIYTFILKKDDITSKIVLTTFITKDGIKLDDSGKEIVFPVIHKTVFIKQ